MINEILKPILQECGVLLEPPMLPDIGLANFAVHNHLLAGFLQAVQAKKFRNLL